MNQPPSKQAPSATPETVTNWREFGAALRALREHSGLTIQALEAKQPDVLKRSTISAYELGKRPSLEWTHCYVTTCLRNRKPPATHEQLTAALSRWETAWNRINRPTTAPTIPTQPATGPDTRTGAAIGQTPATGPAVAATSPGMASVGWRSRRRVRLSRRWLIGGAVTVAVIGGGAVTAMATGLFDASPTSGTSPSAAPAPVVHANGTVDGLNTKQGVDLDTSAPDNLKDQNAQGVDISFSGGSSHLDSMSVRVSYTALPEPGPVERSRCEHATGYSRQFDRVYDLVEGANICVKTDENRYSMLTITKRATAATGTISLQYVTWA